MQNNLPEGFKDPADIDDLEDHFTDDYYLIAELPHISKVLNTEPKEFENGSE